MLINLSNHPSINWPTEQKKAAEVYGEIVDLPFPEVNPEEDEQYIFLLTREYVTIIDQIKKSAFVDNFAVHIMGELTFVYSLVNALKDKNICCIASTTERISQDRNGIKCSEFRFKRFRIY